MAKFLISLILVFVGACFGFAIGKSVYRHEGDYPQTGITYNVVNIIGESEEEKMPGVEMLVSNLNKPKNHLFVLVTKECFSSHVKDAAYLTLINNEVCLWTR